MKKYLDAFCVECEITQQHDGAHWLQMQDDLKAWQSELVSWQPFALLKRQGGMVVI